jgi:hypothetical protein
MTFIVIIFKTFGPTSQKTHCVSTKNTIRVMLLRKISLFILRIFYNPQIRTLSGRNANLLTVYTGGILPKLPERVRQSFGARDNQ